MKETHPKQENITELLLAWQSGDLEAGDKLYDIVYKKLKETAQKYLIKERSNHTLRTTDLVHEAYLRLFGQHSDWKSRSHFEAIAATIMRRILVDYARKNRQAVKVSLETAGSVPGKERNLIDLIALDEAFDRLAKLNDRQAKVIELRFFADLSIEETAEVLGIAPRTVKQDWQVARYWLYTELNKE